MMKYTHTKSYGLISDCMVANKRRWSSRRLANIGISRGRANQAIRTYAFSVGDDLGISSMILPM